MEFCGSDLQKRGLVVPACVQHESLPLGVRYTFALLVRLCGNEDRCWPSQRYLAGQIGISLRSIQKYLQQLEKIGFIAICPGRDGETNTYQLLPHPLVKKELYQRADCEKNAWRTGAKTTPVLKKEEKKNTPPTPQEGENVGSPAHASNAWKPEAIAAFARLWAIWPIQEARKAATRWWMRLWRLQLLPPLETLLAAVKAHIAQNPRWKRGFVPFLATWLKGRRWEDPMPTEPARSVPSPAQAPKPMQEKNFGLQGEKANGISAAKVPDRIWHRLERALLLWPSALSEAELSRVRGLWMYLYAINQLPSERLMSESAKTTRLKFSRWLHVYQQKERIGTSQIRQEAWCCTH